MSNIRGLDVVIQVQIQEEWQLLEEQTSCTFGGQSDVADTTSKNTEGWKTSLITTRTAEVSCEGNYSEDAPVLAFVEQAWAQGKAIFLRAIKNTKGQGYEASYSVSSFEVSGDVSSVAKYTVRFAPTGPVDSIQ